MHHSKQLLVRLDVQGYNSSILSALNNICLAGVIYTLVVNDRGSHLCLGVIYASDSSDMF